MNRPRVLNAAVTVVVLLCACEIAQAEIAPTLTAECAFVNKYLWRGIALTPGAVAQPSVTAGLGVFEAGVWANMDLADVNARPHEFTEVDYSGTFTFGLAGFELSTGAQLYTYTESGADRTTELFAGLSSSWFLSPSITAYRCIDPGSGLYISGGLAPSLPVGPISIDVAATIGWGDEMHNASNYDVRTDGPSDLGITLSSDLPIVPFLKARPMVGYTRLIGNDLRAAAEKPDNVLFGLSIVAGF